jgi:hypothetical protein
VDNKNKNSSQTDFSGKVTTSVLPLVVVEEPVTSRAPLAQTRHNPAHHPQPQDHRQHQPQLSPHSNVRQGVQQQSCHHLSNRPEHGNSLHPVGRPQHVPQASQHQPRPPNKSRSSRKSNPKGESKPSQQKLLKSRQQLQLEEKEAVSILGTNTQLSYANVVRNGKPTIWSQENKNITVVTSPAAESGEYQERHEGTQTKMVKNRSSVATQTEETILPAPSKGYTAEILRGILLELYAFTSQMESALEHLEQQHLEQHSEQQDPEQQHYQDVQQPYAVTPLDQHQAVTQEDVTVLSPARPDISVPEPAMKTSQAQFLPGVAQPRHQVTNLARPAYILSSDHSPSEMQSLQYSQAMILQSQANQQHSPAPQLTSTADKHS